MNEFERRPDFWILLQEEVDVAVYSGDRGPEIMLNFDETGCGLTRLYGKLFIT